jgi:hypothetical protein
MLVSKQKEFDAFTIALLLVLLKMLLKPIEFGSTYNILNKVPAIRLLRIKGEAKIQKQNGQVFFLNEFP